MSVTHTKAIRIDEVGPPEVMKYVDVSLGEPGPGEVLIAQKACDSINIKFSKSGGIQAQGLIEFLHSKGF